ncbi:MAG: hypothetical protein IT433_09570 [Phycisphaerales bacterium]|nr:hypothetical protein [Phycisphaerales bacterium]
MIAPARKDSNGDILGPPLGAFGGQVADQTAELREFFVGEETRFDGVQHHGPGGAVKELVVEVAGFGFTWFEIVSGHLMRRTLAHVPEESLLRMPEAVKEPGGRILLD